MAFGLDDVLFGIAINLVSSAMWDLVRDPLYADEYQLPEDGSRAYASAVQTAIASVAPALRDVPPDAVDAVEDFLSSDEVRQLVMQLYRTRVTAPEATPRTIRDGMLAVWTARHPGDRPAIDVDRILNALVAGCDVMLEHGIKRDMLSAHEAMSASRHAFVVERLESIERQMVLLHPDPTLSAIRFDAFEDRLRGAIVAAYDRLDLAGLGESRRASIADIYVPPPFDVEPNSPATLYEQLTGQTFRLVILGHPGSGKSTFARKLCRDLALRERRLSGGLRSAGILLALRALPKPDGRSPTEQLRAALDDQVFGRFELGPDEGALEYLLTAGRLALVLDGLDELFSAEDRHRLRAGLDGFAERYPLVPLVVTSRIIGYESAPLDEKRYRHAWLGSYTDSQVLEFASRWFVTVLEEREAAADLAVAFVAETSFIADLRSNPLMLGLLCSLYRERGRIAYSRVEVYERCAELLFERWDVQRGLRVDLPIQIFRRLLRRLAWWMLTTPSLGAGVRPDDVVEEIERAAQDWIFDSIESRRVALDFLEYCRGRAWVFTEVGVDADGEPLFHFAHRTFLEFFAGEYVARETGGSAAEVGRSICELVLDGRVTVASIAAGIYARSAPRAAKWLSATILGLAKTDQQRITLEQFVHSLPVPG